MPTQNFKVGELLNRRSLFSKTWINFDGSFTTELHSGQVHFADDQGNLHNINTDLHDDADLDIYEGPVNVDSKDAINAIKERARLEKKSNKLNRDEFDFSALKVPFAAKLPRNFRKGYSIGKGADKLKFKPVGASPARAYVEGSNCLNYQDAWNDADVCLELTPTGIKETITLKTDRAPHKFSFEVEGAIEDDLTSGVLGLQPAWLEDATGEKRDVEQVVRREGDKTFIDLTADVTGLTYPIVIDPTVQIKPSADTGGKDAYVFSAYPSNTYNAFNNNIYGKDSGGGIYETYMQFPLTAVPAGAVITSATLNMRLLSREVGTIQTSVQPVTTTWNSTTLMWSNKPSTTAALDQVVEHTSFQTSEQYFAFPVTNLVNAWYTGQITNNGLALKDVSGNNGNYRVYYSSDEADAAKKPYLEVTYNVPPTKPTVTAPNGGETWNSSHTIAWTASTDTETAQASLRYHIQLSTDNSATWKDIVALTASGATSYTYDFINEAETSTAKIRIRAYDGAIYGPWDESNGVFTIVHNQAPNAPTNLAPASGVRDRATVTRFSWAHNDPNGTDPQSKFDLQWRAQGSGTWNTVTQTTTNQYYDMPANTLPAGVVEWQVRTYDQAGLSGPYSAVTAFNAATKPSAPTITNPANGSTVAVANPVVQWSHPDQIGYDVQISGADGSFYQYINENSTNKAVTVTNNLKNNTNYTVNVAVKGAGGLWSNFTTHNITVSYTAPPIPLISTIKDDERGTITLTIQNPTPTGTEPQVTNNDIYRRENGGDWVKIADNIALNGDFTDYESRPGAAVSYYVTASGTNGTYRDSGIISTSVNVADTQISLVSDPSIYATLKKGLRLSQRNKIDSEKMRFAGREYPLTVFGTEKERDFDYNYLTFEFAQVNAIEVLADAGETLLLRDNLGRKEYVTIDEVTFNELPTHWEINVKPNKVYYVEGV